MRSAGVPPSDLDDEVQRTFIVAARRVDDLQPGAERAFLCQVALNLAWHARARSRAAGDPERPVPEPVETRATPEELIDRSADPAAPRRHRGPHGRILRAVFKLFVIDEMNLAEIAQLLRVPRGTVASRLRRAREQLRGHVGAVDLAWTLGAKGVKRINEPVPVWHKSSARSNARSSAPGRVCPPGPGGAPRCSAGSVWPEIQ